jgi:hypothetical protein
VQSVAGAAGCIAVYLSGKIQIQIKVKVKPELPPLKRRVTFFCHKQQKKGNQRSCFSLNHKPARAVHTR